MKCESVRPELDAYARDELAKDVAREVRAHLEACRDCRDELEATRALIAALAELPRGEVDADALAARVIARGRQRRGVWLAVLAVGVALAAIAIRMRAAPPPRLEPPPPERPPAVVARAPEPVVPPIAPPVVPPDATAPVVPSDAPVVPPTPVVPPDAVPPVVAPPRVLPPPVVVPPVVPPAEKPPLVTPVERATLAWRVTSAAGEPRVRRAGASKTGWVALERGDALLPGDEVFASKGQVELAFARGAAERGIASERVVLSRGAELAVAPHREVAASVAKGEVFASVSGPLVFSVGAATVRIETGDVVLASSSGSVEVTLHAGRTSVEAASRKVDLAEGQRITVDPGGRIGRAAKAAVPRRWYEAPGGVSFVFRAKDPDGVVRLLVGTRDGATLRGATIPAKGPGTKVVCVGRGDAAGLAAHEAGLVLRVRYRLAKSVPLGFQVSDPARARNYQAVLATPRAGAWTEVDVDLEAMTEETRRDRALQAGDRLDLITISAHAEDAALEVTDVLLVRAK